MRGSARSCALSEAAPLPDWSEAGLLGDTLKLRQLASGHRVGTDAVLLAAAAAPRAGQLVIDAGSGVGAVGLMVAIRSPGVSVRLVEREPDLAALALANTRLNGLEDRVAVEQADLLAEAAAARPDADWVLSNPPFRLAARAQPPADPTRSAAYVLPPGVGHGAWLAACVARARPGGHVVVIHQPGALPALLAAASGRLGDLRLRPVHAHAATPAIRVLLAGRVGRRGDLRILPALTLHAPDGGFTEAAAALHRGHAMLDMNA